MQVVPTKQVTSNKKQGEWEPLWKQTWLSWGTPPYTLMIWDHVTQYGALVSWVFGVGLLKGIIQCYDYSCHEYWGITGQFLQMNDKKLYGISFMYTVYRKLTMIVSVSFFWPLFYLLVPNLNWEKICQILRLPPFWMKLLCWAENRRRQCCSCKQVSFLVEKNG